MNASRQLPKGVSPGRINDGFRREERIEPSIVLSEPEQPTGSPKAVHLASVFKFYELNHGPNIRGLAQAQRPAGLCLEFMQKTTGIPLPVVADFPMLRQHAFMCWLRDRGLTVKTISTYQSMIKAVLNFAARASQFWDGNLE